MKTVLVIPLFFLMTIFLAFFVLLPEIGATTDAATWYVSPNGDDLDSCASPSTPCLTINAAIAKAQDGDSIRVARGTYTGEQDIIVTIDNSVHISGGWDSTFTNQSDYSTIDGTSLDRSVTRVAISINENVTATIQRFEITNHKSTNGIVYSESIGIVNSGTVTVTDSIVRDHQGPINGGGIANTGLMTILRCTITGNIVQWEGGGIFNHPWGTMTIIDSIVSNNSAHDGGGIQNHGKINIIRSKIINNLTHSQFVNDGGGGLTNNNGEVYLRDSVVSGNTANGLGGGINNHGTILISGSSIHSNSAVLSGGGLYSKDYTSRITNSTFSSNESDEAGGGIDSQYSLLFINNSTISDNYAPSGGGIRSSGEIKMQNTILATNRSGSGPDCQASITSLGYNILGNVKDCAMSAASGDRKGVDPQIGLIADLLGYNPLAPTSPAIDAGNPAGCADDTSTPLLTDQRGVPRQGRCDIGAYEYTPPGFPATTWAYAGSGQTATIRNLFKEPLNAVVLDNLGVPVPDVPVTFAAPPSGPGALFMDTGTISTSLLTDEWGMVTTPPVVANANPGSFTITVTDSISGTSDTYSLQNIARIYLPTTSLEFCSDFFDDFSNPYSGWPVGEDDTSLSEYTGGEYRVATKSADYIYLFAAPTCERQEYTVEVSARWKKEIGESYGLIFGLEGDFEEFYLFDVNTEYQMYRLFYYDGSEFHPWKYPTPSTAINKGTGANRLKVYFDGLQMILEVNQTVLGTWDVYPPHSPPTSVGLIVSPYSNEPEVDARFDNFAVILSETTAIQRSNQIREGDSLFSQPREKRIAIPNDLDW